jgi:hypothetical protein
MRNLTNRPNAPDLLRGLLLLANAVDGPAFRALVGFVTKLPARPTRTLIVLSAAVATIEALAAAKFPAALAAVKALAVVKALAAARALAGVNVALAAFASLAGALLCRRCALAGEIPPGTARWPVTIASMPTVPSSDPPCTYSPGHQHSSSSTAPMSIGDGIAI